jgi:hypothetical protein
MKKLILALLLLSFPAQANTLYYAGSTNGFYDSAINTTIPSGAVVITQATRDSLMADQASGKIIQADSGGNPVTVNPPAPSAAQVAQAAAGAALASGLVVTSTGTSSLNGTYSVNPTSIGNVNAVVTYILLNGTFPKGASTFGWADASGGLHVFPNVTVFKAFATAFADYVSAVSEYADSGGTVGSIPSNAVTIP